MRKGPGSVYDKWNIQKPWSFVTQIFHNGQPSHGSDGKNYLANSANTGGLKTVTVFELGYE